MHAPLSGLEEHTREELLDPIHLRQYPMRRPESGHRGGVATEFISDRGEVELRCEMFWVHLHHPTQQRGDFVQLGVGGRKAQEEAFGEAIQGAHQ